MVVLAVAGLHDVHHGLAAIDNDPLPIGLALHPGLGKTGITHRVAHACRQRLGLAVGRARGHHHALKQRREVFGVEHHNVLGFHVFQRINDGALEFLYVFFGGGRSSHQAVW